MKRQLVRTYSREGDQEWRGEIVVGHEHSMWSCHRGKRPDLVQFEKKTNTHKIQLMWLFEEIAKCTNKSKKKLKSTMIWEENLPGIPELCYWCPWLIVKKITEMNRRHWNSIHTKDNLARNSMDFEESTWHLNDGEDSHGTRAVTITLKIFTTILC